MVVVTGVIIRHRRLIILPRIIRLRERRLRPVDGHPASGRPASGHRATAPAIVRLVNAGPPQASCRRNAGNRIKAVSIARVLPPPRKAVRHAVGAAPARSLRNAMSRVEREGQIPEPVQPGSRRLRTAWVLHPEQRGPTVRGRSQDPVGLEARRGSGTVPLRHPPLTVVARATRLRSAGSTAGAGRAIPAIVGQPVVAAAVAAPVEEAVDVNQ